MKIGIVREICKGGNCLDLDLWDFGIVGFLRGLKYEFLAPGLRVNTG